MSDSFFRTFVSEDEPALPEVDTGVAHIARVYDYWLGGKDHFAADREVGDRVLEIHPETVQSVRANRGFLARSVRYLAYKEGIRQFLDIGTGLPSANNTHEVAQATARQARVVYVDNDPIVLAHARALLTSGPDGATAILDADVRDIGQVLAGAGQLLDFSEPVAVMLVALLHMIPDEDDPYGIVDRYMAAVPPGSFLVLSHLASDVEAETIAEMARRMNQSMTQQVIPRSRAEVTRFFDGLDLLDPGVVLTHEWRPDADDGPPGILWSGVARKA